MGSEKVLSLLSLPQVEVSCLVTSTERTKLRVTAPHTLASPGRERRERGRARWEDWNVVKEMPVADWLNPQMTTPTKGKPTTSYPAGGRSQQLFRYDSYPVLCFLCFLHILFSLYIVYTGISSYLQMLCTFFPPFFESYFPLKRKVEKKTQKRWYAYWNCCHCDCCQYLCDLQDIKEVVIDILSMIRPFRNSVHILIIFLVFKKCSLLQNM